MTVVRQYYPADAIKLLNGSEGKAGRSSELAHSMSRHLRQSPRLKSAGEKPLHQGVDADVFARRFENNPLNDDGSDRINSGWLGKGDMAMLLCRLLNSPAGRSGLAGLDAPATRAGAKRVMVQAYFTSATDLSGTKFSGARAEMRTSTVAPTITRHGDDPRNPLHGQIRTIRMNRPVHRGVIRRKDIVGAVAVLDNVGDSLHIQTFYPLFTVSGRPKAEYDVGPVRKVVEIGSDGAPHTTLQLR